MNDEPIGSPCISVCVMDDVSKYCLGCYRTGVEVENWIIFTDEEKKHIIDCLEMRRNNLSYLGFLGIDKGEF